MKTLTLKERFKRLKHLCERFPEIKEAYCNRNMPGVTLFVPNDNNTRTYILHVAKKYYGLSQGICSGTPHQKNNWFFYREERKAIKKYTIGCVTIKDFGDDKF
jgi:hypothetical protein